MQEDLDRLKTSKERNRWGQFATPPSLAEDLLRYAKIQMGDSDRRIRFLDPAIGTGSFYSALRKVFVSENIETAMGVELDPKFAAAALHLWNQFGLEVIQSDFTKLQPADNKLFNLLVCNPPYVRHHYIGTSQKEQLQHMIVREHGLRISGLAGLYCYFMLLSDHWLEKDSLSIWLIPSEFLDVNYGTTLKKYLIDKVQLLRIHRFCPSDVQFSDALVSSAVVIFKKARSSEPHNIEMSFGGSLLSPELMTKVSADLLRTTRKWSVYPSSDLQADTYCTCPLG